MIELQIDGFTSNHKLVLTVPVSAKHDVTGSGAGTLRAQAGAVPATFTYAVGVSEERADGAVVDLSVVATAEGGGVRTLKRSVFVPHEEIVEQMYVGGVNMKAYFKMKPVNCHNINGQ